MIIDGKKIAAKLQAELKELIAAVKGRKPGLAVILVGNNPASQIYVNMKAKACESIGIHSVIHHLPADISQENLLKKLNELNNDSSIDGILVQLPLPMHLNTMQVIQHISPEKDVDGLHPINAGRLLIGDHEGFVPCTPLGIKVLLENLPIDVLGQHVLVIGRSNLVGKPIATLLLQNSPGANATVTIAHRYTQNIKALTLQADILIVAIGQPKFITADMVKENAIVIDVGINKIPDKSSPKGFQIVGDVDFENVKEKSSFITPVPGGVGPMTIAMLLSNTWKSFFKREYS